jgi:hypothetical protein
MMASKTIESMIASRLVTAGPSGYPTPSSNYLNIAPVPPWPMLVLGHGFKREMLAGLVLAGLATVVTETMKAGAATIKIERYMITDDGRRALE